MMKIKKEKIYLMIIIVLFLCIVSLIIFRITFKTKEYKNINLYGAWSLYASEIYNDDKLVDTLNDIRGLYYIIDEDNLDICTNNQNNIQGCTNYEYIVNENQLIIYSSDSTTTYTYSLKDNDTLALTYVIEENKIVNYYAKSKG